MEMYGTDKPDLEEPLIISDVTQCFKNSGLKFLSLILRRAML